MRVRFAVRVLYEEYVTPLDPAQLFGDAWQGAANALQQAGVQNLPPPPVFPHDFDAAAALHTAAFPALERLAQGRLSDRQIIDAALKQLGARRNDCHTQYLPPDLAPQAAANLRGQAKQLVGVQFSTQAPLRIVAVTPGSDAERAGLRRGLLVIAVNGEPVGQQTPAQALASVARHNQDGQPSSFGVAEPGGAPFDVTLTPQPIPLAMAVREPGNLGLLRFDTFALGDAQYQELRQDLARFESEGVRGWILDLRFNGGGQPPDKIAGLFLQSGLLWTMVTRDGAPEAHSAAGNTLPVQRPLVVLTGRGSLSSAEILAAVLQTFGRAKVVGEQTSGCVGEAKIEGLLDGSWLEFSIARVLIGPQQRNIAGSGVMPDVAVAPDDAAANDPQLLAAIRLLQQEAVGP
ncbi:MAG TPA: S41 family peptidase [Dehalococcoidia bacterium]|nr:S41 family peptidase [Dehalococcoidia bacterium]